MSHHARSPAPRPSAEARRSYRSQGARSPSPGQASHHITALQAKTSWRAVSLDAETAPNTGARDAPARHGSPWLEEVRRRYELFETASPNQPLCGGMLRPSPPRSGVAAIKLLRHSSVLRRRRRPAVHCRAVSPLSQVVPRRLPSTPFTYRAEPCDVVARAVADSPAGCCCANRDAPQGLTARSIEV